MIPKIIHTLAPEDKNKWDPMWEKCNNSWHLHFPKDNFEHMMWSDEDCLELVKNDYPQFLDFYNSLPHYILKLDIARILILHKFGGIYHDMDYFCYKNFYSVLTDNSFESSNIFIVKSNKSHSVANEFIQNSLICSTKQPDVWIDVVKISKKLFSFYQEDDEKFLLLKNNVNPLVLHLTGPNFLIHSFLMLDVVDSITFLDADFFNPNINFYSEDLFAKHLHTGSWYLEKPNKLDSVKEYDLYKNYFLNPIKYS